MLSSVQYKWKRKTPAAPRTESAAPQSQSVYKQRFHWVYKSLYKSGWARLGYRYKTHHRLCKYFCVLVCFFSMWKRFMDNKQLSDLTWKHTHVDEPVIFAPPVYRHNVSIYAPSHLIWSAECVCPIPPHNQSVTPKCVTEINKLQK